MPLRGLTTGLGLLAASSAFCAQLVEISLPAVPSTLELTAGERAMLIIDSPTPIKATRQIHEYRCSATTYLQPIGSRGDGLSKGDPN